MPRHHTGLCLDVNLRARTHCKEDLFFQTIKARFENCGNNMVIVRMPYEDFL